MLCCTTLLSQIDEPFLRQAVAQAARSCSLSHLLTEKCLGAVQGPRDLKFFLASNAGPADENSLLGVPNEVDTGESIGSGQKVNVCKFPLGSVNNWNVSRASSGVAMHEKMIPAVTLLLGAHRPHYASGRCMHECILHLLRAHSDSYIHGIVR